SPVVASPARPPPKRLPPARPPARFRFAPLGAKQLAAMAPPTPPRRPPTPAPPASPREVSSQRETNEAPSPPLLPLKFKEGATVKLPWDKIANGREPTALTVTPAPMLTAPKVNTAISGPTTWV